MKWSRVKTVLIVLMFAVNVFLFGMYASKSAEHSENEQQVRREVCSVLGKLGYELPINILPADSQIYYPARVTRSVKSERGIMSAALEQTRVENSVGVTTYKGEKGEITLRGGGYVDAKLIVSSKENAKEDAADIMREKLKAIRVELFFVKEQEGVTQGICAVSGRPVFNCRVEGKTEDGVLLLTGRIPTGDVSFIQNIKPYAVSGLMLDFAQHMKSLGIDGGKIERIEPGYAVNSPTEFESGVTELVPVWNIRMNGQDWYVNALTGKVETLE